LCIVAMLLFAQSWRLSTVVEWILFPFKFNT
jgi:hypothetical protein